MEVWGDRRGRDGVGGGSALHSDEIKWRLKC